MSYVRFLPIINEVCQEHEFLFQILRVVVMKLQTPSLKLYNTDFYLNDLLKD